jgi:Lysophospholipase L1 and related esterases
MLVLGEIVVRLFAAGTYDVGGPEYQKLMQQIPLNSYGMRGREYALEKPNGTYRILVLGDSFTFGHGIVNTSQIWPELLEQSLNNTAPVEVINTAQNGLETEEEIAILNRTLAFKPDLVMLGYFFNDAMTDEMLRSQDEVRYGPISGLLHGADAVLFTHSYLYSFLKTRITATRIRFGLEKSYPEAMNDVYKQRDSLNLHKQQLLRMRDMAASANASFIIVIIPANYDFDNYPLAEGHRFMKEFCAQERLQCIDLYDAFKDEDYRVTRLNPYDAHPSPYGHRIIARELTKALKAQLLNIRSP